MSHVVKLLYTEFVTHDTKSFIVEKPDGYSFAPGQATTLAINQDELKNEARPFTFSSLPDDEVLQFIIKNYPEHNGITKKMHEMESGAELILGDPWGSMHYHGKGVFIAGGVGITPFVSMFRNLYHKDQISGHTLIYSNKTERDIILEHELAFMFSAHPEKITFCLTREDNPRYDSRRIDEAFLKEKIQDFSQNFYICGPPAMITEIKEILTKLGAKVDTIIFEG